METIFLIIVIVGTAILAWLGWLNRESDVILEKFLPAIVIGIIGSLFTLWFSLKEEKQYFKIPVTYIINEDTGETLEKCDEKYRQYYTSNRISIKQFLTSIAKKDLTSQQRNTYVPKAIDHLFLETLALLFTPFQESSDALGVSIGTFTTDPVLQYFPNQFLSWGDFIKQNKHKFTPEMIRLYSQLEKIDIPGKFGMTHMCLPTGTSIKIDCDDPGFGEGNIKLKSKFCEINIKIFRLSFIRGLREWKWILEYDKSKDEEFFTHNMGIHFSVKYAKLLSGHPDMPKYKDWTNSILDRLQTCLDSKQQLHRAREKYHVHKDNIGNEI